MKALPVRGEGGNNDSKRENFRDKISKKKVEEGDEEETEVGEESEENWIFF